MRLVGAAALDAAWCASAVADTDGIPADDERYLVLDAPPLPAALLLGDAAAGDDVFLLRDGDRIGRPGAARSRSRCWAATRAARSTAATARERQVIVLSGTRG